VAADGMGDDCMEGATAALGDTWRQRAAADRSDWGVGFNWKPEAFAEAQFTRQQIRAWAVSSSTQMQPRRMWLLPRPSLSHLLIADITWVCTAVQTRR
jgi:hypothetical protein